MDSRLGSPDFWTLAPAALPDFFRDSPFSWNSSEKSELRAAGEGLTYLDLSVAEVVIRLGATGPREVFVSFYNRGDLGRIADDSFEAYAAKVEAAVAGHAGVAAEDLGDEFKRSSIRSVSKVWSAPAYSARLDTAYSRVRESGELRRQDRPEFINLTLFPPGTASEGMRVQRKADTALLDLRQRLKKLDNGDVFLEGVPMVDQGQKGYCAVATMERILRYYGSEVNQHELAQQANASGEGTNPDSLVQALRNMGGKLGLRVDEKINFESKDFFDLVEDYNKLAKRKQEPEIRFGGMRVISMPEILASMQPELVREIRLKSQGRVDKFYREITDTIDQGRPLAWGVQLGWVEEKPKLPQARGGHMRLIIGYQPQKREVLYTDSWGYGHELKRLPLEDAYMMTNGLFVVEPRN
ncbi:MAG: cysteine peptidase family C39 domain-containing protein [Candidatus Methylacidiphilales bacterium]|nr:cysteine peptidase family C39 domain-containing protein [Candidatus Methylacidiphilales bacterium]